MRPRWVTALAWIASVMLGGCSGDGPPLPEWLTDPPPLEETLEDSTNGDSTNGDSTNGTATSSTGPSAECGNGVREFGEQCDDSDLGGLSCTGLGLGAGELGCDECQLDLSSCDPPPGMVLVPGGLFEMGANVNPDEQPIRQVVVSAFWIDRTEVTVAAYSACVDAGACDEPNYGTLCNWMAAGREDHPVTCVSWLEATAYCGWVAGGTKRLPTEAEWEKAARGKMGFTYPWGDSLPPTCEVAVMDDPGAGGDGCGADSSMPVGSKPLGVSPYGAQDMAGNAWEWVADWYASSYDATDTYDPVGPEEGRERVMRGGSYESSHSTVRTAYRGVGTPTSSYGGTGFRCARPAAISAPSPALTAAPSSSGRSSTPPDP